MVIITTKVPKNNHPRRALFPAIYAATLMLCLSAKSQAGEWDVRPRLDLRETYTDNVRLRPEGSEQSDFITQINPGVSLTGLGRRFNLNVNYLANNLIYAETSGFNRTRHQLNARGTAELLEDFFFVDGRALISQQNISLLGPQSFDNVNVTGNRADIRTFSISPYIRHRFQDFASAEVRYSQNVVTSNANALRNSQGNSVMASLISGEAFSTLNWGVNYSNQMIHFDRTGRTVELERSIANVGYRVTPQFGLMATGGYERNSFISIRGSPSSPTWTVGFSWVPSERTSVVASAGQRFFGDTYSVLARHRTRLTIWDVSYNENITTFNQQAQFGGFGLGGSFNQLIGAQNPGFSPGAIQQTGDSLLGQGVSGAFFDPNNFLTNRLFLQKRFQASAGMNGTRNTLVFRVFNMTRHALSPDTADAELIGPVNAALLSNTRQSGANAFWNYRISQFTSANFNFGYTRFSFLTSTREDDLMLVTSGLTRRLPHVHPNLVGMLQYRHNRRYSNQAAANYSENAVYATLNMSF